MPCSSLCVRFIQHSVSHYKHITSLSWSHAEDKFLAWTCNDDSVMFWDVRSGAKADKINLSSTAHSIVWNQRDAEMFATGHDKEVKFWDRRKFSEGCPELTSFATHGSPIKKMQFDPAYGRLFMAQGRDTVRLFRADDCQELDVYHHARQELVTSQFLPFRDAGAPGLILLPNRSSSFVYLQVEEGTGKTLKQQSSYGSAQPFSSDGGQLSDKQGGSSTGGQGSQNQGWSLRLRKKQAELAGPKPQHSSHEVSPDIDAFAVRRQDNGAVGPSGDVFQVISVSSDHSIRIMTLNKPFVQEFFEKGLPNLSDSGAFHALEIAQEELPDERLAVGPSASSPERKAEPSQAQKTKNELEEVRGLSFVSSAEVVARRRAVRDQFEGQFDGADEEAFELTLGIALSIGSTTAGGYGSDRLSIQVVIPPDYPYEALQMQFGGAYGISAPLLATLQREVPPQVAQSGHKGQRVGQYMTLVNALWLVHSTLSGQKIVTHQLTPQSSEDGMGDDYDDGVDLGPSPDLTVTEGEDQSSTGARSKHPMDGALLTPQRKRTREEFGAFGTQSPQKDGLRKDWGKGKKSREKRHFFAYPKSCGFSWNCHGQIVFFSNEKYNFDALKKDPGLKRFQDWPAQKGQLTSREHDADFRAQTSDHDPTNQHLVDVTDRDDA